MKEKIKVRQVKFSDIPGLLKLDEEAWPQFRANKEMFEERIRIFPEGQFVALCNGKVIGSVFTQLINYQDWEDKTFTWNEITDFGTLQKTHNPHGDTIYGVGLAVSRQFQSGKACERLLIAVASLTIARNCQQVILGARIPGFSKRRNTPKYRDISVESYITTNLKGRLIDPELALYQRYGGKPIKPLPDYINDSESLNFGVLVSFKNPFYNKFYRKGIAWFLKACPVVVW